MNRIDRVTVDVSAEEADQIERMVSTGEYESPSDVVRAGLDALLEHQRAIEHWLRTEVVETYDRIQRGELEMISIAQLREELRQRRAGRDAAE